MQPVLALDQGTSGTKALVVCPDRGVLASAYHRVRPRYGPGGAVEVDPADLLASVLSAGRQALAAAGEPVAAVGLANQGETVLAWFLQTGRPVSQAVVWQDRRSADLCAALAAADPGLPHRLHQITGLTLDPYFAAPKMAWLRRRVPDGVVTTSDSWILHALCGAFVTDASTASRTQLLDLDSTTWSPAALAAFGLDGERLPEVVDSAGPVGITHAFDDALPPGSARGLRVTGLLVDQQAALLAQGCLAAGQAKCTYGTGAFVLATTGPAPVRSSRGLAASVAWRLAGRPTYCLDGQVLTVGSAVRWITDLGLVAGSEELDDAALSVPDSGGVQFVPAFAGLAAPRWHPRARAQLSGLSLDSGRGHIVRALCEGIAADVVDLAEAVEADLGSPIDVLRVDGGLTRSTALMQAQADLLQRPVECSPLADATALGVAAAAMMGLDSTLTPADAVRPGPPSALYRPRIGPAEAADRLGRHRLAVTAVLTQADARTPGNDATTAKTDETDETDKTQETG